MTPSRLLALFVGLLLPLLMSTAAFAHAVIQPGNAPAGEMTTFQILIPHGCSPGEPPPPAGTEVADTRLVSVEIPEGVTVSGASEPGDFTVEITDAEITWSGGVLANEDPGEFTFDATLSGDDGTAVAFNVYQECTDELNYRWSGAEGDATPAPVVVVGSEAADGSHGEMDMSASEGASEAMDMSEADPTEMATAMAEDMADDTASEPAEAMTEDMAEEMAEDTATEAAPTEAAATEAAAEDAAAPAGAPATGQGGAAEDSTAIVVGGLAIALLAGAGALAMRRRQQS